MSVRQFDAVEVEGVRSSYYDMSHDHKYTSLMAELIPVLMEETLPGDNWQIRPEIFQRFAPMIAPVMHKIDNFIYTFYVPNRLIWRNFNDFIKNSSDSTTFNDNKTYVPPVAPYFTITQLVTIADNLANGITDSLSITLNNKTVNVYCLKSSVVKLLENIGVPIDLSNSSMLSALHSTYDSDLTSDVIDSFYSSEGYRLVRFQRGSSSNLIKRLSYGLSTLKISSLPLRAYFKIWFEWFRDKNLESVAFDFDQDGQEPDTQLAELLKLRLKCWEHDYFTSALPDPQRGPDVMLQVAGTKSDVRLKSDSTNNGLFKYASDHQLTAGAQLIASISGVPSPVGANGTSSELVLEAKSIPASAQGQSTAYQVGVSRFDSPVAYDPNGTLEVDFTNAQIGFTINQLRYQSTLQRFYELFARVGNRIKEWIDAVFDVDLSDARAMITEYCGGHRAPVQVSSVEQTSQSDKDSDQYLGQLGGRAQSSSVAYFKHYCPEHGFIVVLQTTLPRTSYMQMLRTKFTRRTYLDYCIPMFQSLGEQEVRKHEICFDCSSDVSNDAVFGYQARYQDYKYIPDMVAGDFLRSLNFYTLARHFDSAPSLNVDFTKAQPSDRIFCVQDGTDTLWNDMYFDIKLNRKLAYYSLPKID